jgi:hypothetical protein
VECGGPHKYYVPRGDKSGRVLLTVLRTVEEIKDLKKNEDTSTNTTDDNQQHAFTTVSRRQEARH